MKYKSIAKQIIELNKADIKLRNILIHNGELGDGYNKEMEKLHNKNADLLNEIIDDIGYPIVDKVGKEANEAAWLVIQHAIGKPKFMKKCAKLLETAVIESKDSPIKLAYLIDRIAVFDEEPQLYGTQFDWNEDGELCPNHFDDLEKVNQRRKKIGFNTTLKEQTEIIRKQAKNENQTPPTDLKIRKNEIDKWRKRVGWKKC